MNKDIEIKTKNLVDELKKVCADHGLGNDGNEYKIITEVFLYKFMNDKFFYEVKKRYPKYRNDKKLEDTLKALNAEEYGKILRNLPGGTAKLKPEQYLSNLFHEQNRPDFDKYFDDTLIEIANNNAAIFSVGTAGGEKIRLFSGIRNYITEEGKRDGFCRSIVNKLVDG
jgi:type I restriction enzyme M protein